MVVLGRLAGALQGLLGQGQFLLALPDLRLQSLEKGQLPLCPLQCIPGGDGTKPGLLGEQRVQLCLCLSLVVAGLGILEIQLPLGNGLMKGQLPGAEGMLPSGLGPLSLQLVELVVELGELACTAGQFRLLLLQLRDAAHALVDLAAVEPLLELSLHLGVGYILLPGGNQGGDAGLQLRGGADGQGAALSDEGGALIDLPAYAQQHLAAGVGGQAGDGLLGAGIHGGEAAKGHIAPRPSPNGNVLALPLQGDLPLHGGAGPGLVAVLVGQVALSVPVPGVDAVEHGLQKGAPGGLSSFVGGGDDVESRLQSQALSLELAESGSHGFDLHGATSSPRSRAARPKRTASCKVSSSGSA